METNLIKELHILGNVDSIIDQQLEDKGKNPEIIILNKIDFKLLLYCFTGLSSHQLRNGSIIYRLAKIISSEEVRQGTAIYF